MLKGVSKQFSTNLNKIILIILGTITWSLTMVRNGCFYEYGCGFWGANGHDGIWHLSLSKSLSQLTLENPVFSGNFIKNYHLGFDLLIALLNRLTSIPVTYLYFQVLPPILALLIGVLVYNFVYTWRNSKNEAFWATFFVYFSGSFGFVITFLRDRVFTGESMFWSQQSVSTLVNPPFALSLVFILTGLVALKNKKIFLSVLSFGFLLQIKSYAAILVLGGLFVAGLYSFVKNKNNFYLKVFIFSLVTNVTLLFLVKNDGLSAFVWQPFWYLETLMSYSDRLGWSRFYSAMTTYKLGHLWIKETMAYGVSLLIFLVGNLGLRVIGVGVFIDVFKKKIKLDENIIFISSIIIAAIGIPMLFVQKGTPWNTIQFFYYALFFFAIFAGISAAKFTEKSNFSLKILAVVLISAYAVFSIWATLQHYLPKMPQAIVSNDELEALNFLSREGRGVVLAYPFDGDKAKAAISNPPRPLYFYDSTAYVSAFTGQRVFEEDEVNLNIMGYNWKTRREEILSFVSNLDIVKGKEFLKTNNIKYLYLIKSNSPLFGEQLKLGPSELGLEKIFENKESIIYRYGENIGGN
jgi:hypothetical protein